MTTMTSLRSSSLFPQTVRSSNGCSKAPASASGSKTPSNTPTGFGGESSFDVSSVASGTRAPASSSAELQALKNIDDLLDPSKNRFRASSNSTVTADALDVEKSNSDPATRRQASAQLQANASLEQQRLAGMSAQDRAQYQAVKDTLSNQDSNPVAALALQKLLFQGKLPGSKDLVGQGSLLDHLASAAQGTNLDPRVDKKAFVTDLVQELATPSAINQGGRGTCAPTAMSINLAFTQPAEYARILQGLGSPSGQVKLADGKTTLTRKPETSFQPDNSRRSLTQRLMAPVFMDATNGNKGYNDKTGQGAGASSTGVDVLQDAIYGRNMGFIEAYNSSKRGEAMQRIDSELKEGQYVQAGLKWGTGGHKVLVTGTEKVGGEDYIKFINPWGDEERMKRSEFQSRLNGINYDPAAGTFQRPARRAV